MKRALAIGGLVLVAGAGIAWTATNLIGGDDAPSGRAPAVSAAVPPPASRPAASAIAAGDAVEVEEEGGPTDYGVTPMAQRVAVLGLLNKRNGVSRDVSLKPGQAIRVGDVVIRLRACERTAPWEQEPLTGAFVQLDVRGADQAWRRAFSGWLYKERPALNVVLHPVYDVWTKSCATTFPGTAPSPSASASSARKSAPAPAASSAAETEPSDAASAVASNAI